MDQVQIILDVFLIKIYTRNAAFVNMEAFVLSGSKVPSSHMLQLNALISYDLLHMLSACNHIQCIYYVVYIFYDFICNNVIKYGFFKNVSKYTF